MYFSINKQLENAVNVYIVDKSSDFKDNNENLINFFDNDHYIKKENFEFFHYITEIDNVLIIKSEDLFNLNVNNFRLLGFLIAEDLKSKNYSKLNISILNNEINYNDKFIISLTEGFLQSNYKFTDYKSEKEEKTISEINFILPENGQLTEKDFNELKNIVEGINITRELVNLPSIELYPETLALKAKNLLEPLGVKVTVYDIDSIKELNMTAFLAVARGSSKEPKFIKIEYNPVKDGKVLGLVGKGLTYDSGGYAIKDPISMALMHCDMAGAATVIGSIYALAKNKVQQNIVGIIAACENMISGDSYKNGDIIRSMKGTTIEIKNTDAEGRVTLADALYYTATKTNASTIIDLATLTGACMVALGEITTGVITNNESIYKNLQQASFDAGEYIWQLPSFTETRELLKSKIADLTNSTGKFGGAITAGLFLEEFVEEKPWAHLDIAGPAYTTTPYSYIPYGATGIPVKTIYFFAKNHFNNI